MRRSARTQFDDSLDIVPITRINPLIPSARSDDTKPHAVFDEISPALEPDVADHLANAVEAWLPPDAPASAHKLLDLIGSPDFYDVVAQLDPKSASDWREMGRVQRSFRAAEPKFDEKTRAYSESMRLTLHAALIEHLCQPNAKSLFETFLELHPTAFYENGAWLDNMQIGWKGALDVVGATRPEMVFHTGDLVEGGFEKDQDAVRAAAWVRDARNAVIAETRGAPATAASSAPPRRFP
jgi:hypothetical protein